MNIRSLRAKKKLEELEIIIKTRGYLTHLIIITETWLEENETKLFNIPNYEHYTCTRPLHAGGVSIFVHNSITANSIYNTSLNNNNILGLEIYLQQNIKFNIFGIYKQPSADNNSFISQLHTILDKYKNTFYFGDFNIDLLDNTSNHVNNYMDAIYSTGNIILNKIEKNYFTRKAANTIIDHIITDNINEHYNIHLNDTHISDHRYIITNIKFNKYIKSTDNLNKTMQIIEYNKMNRSHIHKIVNTNTLNSFMNNIKNIIIDNTTLKTLNNERKQILKPWISKNTIKLIQCRNNYYKLKIKYPNNILFQTKFIFFRNKVSFLLNKEKQNYYEKKFENNINDNKKFWKTTNEIIFNKNNLKSIQNITLTHNNTTTCNDIDVANIFNNFFINVCNNNTIIPTNIIHPLPIQYNNTSNFHLYPTTPSEINSIIKHLNKKAANGYDDVSIKFFQTFSNELAGKLSQLINNSFKTGYYPEILKIGKITPIYKSGNKHDVSNYRPISVLPSCAKIFDKAIQIRLEQFIINNNIVHKNQFGFVTKSSTLAASTQLMNYIDSNLDKKNVVGCLFIDLKKAYDSINLSTLLKKLEQTGINNIALNLFKSYHSNRYQYVQINGEKSQQQQIKNGVVQGSMLSAPEFSIYINEMFYLNLCGEVQMYADDAIVMFSCENIEMLMTQMEGDMITINQWLKINHLELNFDKSNFMIFDKNIEYNNISNYLKIDNKEIKRIYTVKYLGLLIDSKLTWNQHINKIKNKIRPITFAIRRLRNYLHPKALQNIYNAHIVSHLSYLNPIWSSCSETKMKELKVLQNKVVKAMYYHPLLYSTESLYKIHPEILPLFKINILQIATLIFKINNNFIKHNFTITYRYNHHIYPTRQHDNINVPYARTNLGLNTILYRGVQIFNQLPKDIKSCTRISIFKNKMKMYLKDLKYV